jgi:hypothetical protein
MRHTVSSRELRKWEAILSRSQEDVDLEPCTYCGLPANSIDHVPPRSVRKAIREQGMAHWFPFVEVPACRECNSAVLGDRGGWKVESRRAYVKKVLRRRYASILRIPDWTDRELALMSPTLAQHIQAGINARELTIKRLGFQP